MPRRLNLRGSTVLLTGAAGGIGAAGARALVDRGARVALVDLEGPALHDVAAELGPSARVFPGDVTDLDRMRDIVAEVLAWTGHLDVVWANAGIAAGAPTTIELIDEDRFEQVLEVNLLGVWRTVRAALPAVRAAEGHVVLTASIYAFANGIANAPYAASKAAVESFGRSLRAELAGTGATAGVLYPGWIETPIVEASRHTDRTAMELIQVGFPGPFGRIATPAQVATAAVDGIHRRSARTIFPRVWVGWSLLRGLVSPTMDFGIDRYRRVHRLVRRLEADRRARP